MSIPGSLTPLFSTGGGAVGITTTIERSLRFNSADSAYLSRTPGTAGNRRTWTWAGWVKRSVLGTQQNLFRGGAGTSNSTNVSLYFKNNDTIQFGGWNSNFIGTTAVYRDCSAWYHVALVVDTTLSSNRIKLYVNNVEQAITQDGGYPAQNDYLGVNLAQLHTIGGNDAISGYADLYLADIHFIDGQALDATAFTQVSATTGQLVPKAYTGSFNVGAGAVNGFWLKFSDNSAATAAALGNDYSGNNNDWTPNLLSVTAGAGNDSLVDTPTSYGTDTYVGGDVRGNYCTFNPLAVKILSGSAEPTFANGNLDVTGAANNSSSCAGTFGVSSGKWYIEYTVNSQAETNDTFGFGIRRSLFTGAFYDWEPYFRGTRLRGSDNGFYAAESGGSFSTITPNGTVIGIAFDIDSNYCAVYVNNSIRVSSNSAGLSGYTWFPFIAGDGGGAVTFNAGQRAFAYTAPSGFKALCDTNLGAPLVALPNTLMDVLTWSGTGGNRSFSSLNMSPDFVWIKQRNQSYSVGHQLYDIVRGAGALKQLDSSNTTAEGGGNTNHYGYLSSFDSTGFSVTAGSIDSDYVNKSGVTYVAWCWDAGANSGKTYTVTVSGGIFYIDGISQPTINLEEGSTYIFDQSAASNSGHPLRFSTTSNGTHGGGTEYTTGVTTTGTPGSAGAQTQIAVAAGAPALYYYCTVHSGMGGAINTNTTAGASNFAGSITSSVRANASAGFSIVTYTGTGSAATVGHGLGAAPSMIITKSRNNAYNWTVYHSSLGINQYLWLDSTAAASGSSGYWNTAPTSTIFGVANNNTGSSGSNIVAYCFAPVTGYSSFGSYTGNGSADGPFVFTGHRSRWLMVKRSDAGLNDWYVLDTARSTYNVAINELLPNSSSAENPYTGVDFDLLSNGFKIRATEGSINASGGTFIYAAFAENPFQYARAR